MHRKRYAHADIKGANILLGNEVNDDKEEQGETPDDTAKHVEKEPVDVIIENPEL